MREREGRVCGKTGSREQGTGNTEKGVKRRGLLLQQGGQGGEEGIGDDFGAFGGGVDAIWLDGSGDVDEVLINHGDEGCVVLGGEVSKDLVERLDVVAAVVRRERDAGEQDADMGVFESRKDGVEVAACLGGGHTAKAVVAAEFDDDDGGMKLQDWTKAGGCVLGGGAAGSKIRYFVMEATLVEVSLQSVGIGLSGVEAVTCSDAVTVTDDDGRVCGKER